MQYDLLLTALDELEQARPEDPPHRMLPTSGGATFEIQTIGQD